MCSLSTSSLLSDCIRFTDLSRVSLSCLIVVVRKGTVVAPAVVVLIVALLMYSSSVCISQSSRTVPWNVILLLYSSISGTVLGRFNFRMRSMDRGCLRRFDEELVNSRCGCFCCDSDSIGLVVTGVCCCCCWCAGVGILVGFVSQLLILETTELEFVAGGGSA